jgi:hypothetical protein
MFAQFYLVTMSFVKIGAMKEYVTESHKWVQAGLVLPKFVSRYFPLTWLENLHHFSYLCDSFQFNTI